MKIKKSSLILILLSITFLLGLASYSPDIPVSELKIKYTNQFSKFVQIDGMDVHYRDEGIGQVIVLLHGTGASLHTWDKWTKELKKKYRVIRLDLPAYGLTGPKKKKKYLISDYSNFLNSFVELLQIDDFILSGNSLGGAIAWFYASEHQDKIKLLCLLNPSGFINKDKGSPFVIKLARTPIINKLLRYVTPRFFIKNTLKEVYYDKTKLSNKKIDTYRDMVLRENNRESFIDRSLLKSEDYTNRLKFISTPTQIIWGEEDAWIPVSNATLFEKELPNTVINIMQKTGHIPMEERPLESLNLLLNFINSN